METDVKYRVVKSGKNYAIQKKYIRINTDVTEMYLSRFSQKQPYGTFSKHDVEWYFLKPIGAYNEEDEDIIEVDCIFAGLNIGGVYTRTYKTKKAAQDALKQHLWDTMVEPIDGQEEWKQVNKG